MSDTPQTDAVVEAAILQDRNHPRIDWVPASFARELERERDEARKELEEYRSIAENIGAVKAVSEKEKAICERNESLEELKPLRQRTPETDDFELNLDDYSNPWKAIDFARKLERERDEAREKVEQQRKEIVRLNGATNHAGGTPLKIALRERDEARERCAKLQDIAERAVNLGLGGKIK